MNRNTRNRHPSTLDNVVLALLRNRLGHRQLQEKLLRLEHQQVSELRMLRTLEHRVCRGMVHTTRAPLPSSSVLARLASTLPPSATLVRAAATTAAAEQLAPADAKAARVRMFETHWPGFCYRRDGALRAPGPAPHAAASAARRRVEAARLDAERLPTPLPPAPPPSPAHAHPACARAHAPAHGPGPGPGPAATAAATAAAAAAPDDASMQLLRDLVLSDGEADVRKLLCLHALSAVALPCPCGCGPDGRRGPHRCRLPLCSPRQTPLPPGVAPASRLPCYVLAVEEGRAGTARSMWLAATADEPWQQLHGADASKPPASGRTADDAMSVQSSAAMPAPAQASVASSAPKTAGRSRKSSSGSRTRARSGHMPADKAKTKKPDVAGDAVVRDEVDKDAKRHRAKKKHRSHEKERTHDKAKEKGAAEEKGEATATAKVADGDDDPRPRPGHVELYVNEEVDALVGTVLEALDGTNAAKAAEARALAATPARLAALLADPALLPFVDSLLGCELLSARRCFAVRRARLLPAAQAASCPFAPELVAFELRVPAVAAPADALRHLLAQVRRAVSREGDWDMAVSGPPGTWAEFGQSRQPELPSRVFAPYKARPAPPRRRASPPPAADKALSSKSPGPPGKLPPVLEAKEQPEDIIEDDEDRSTWHQLMEMRLAQDVDSVTSKHEPPQPAARAGPGAAAEAGAVPAPGAASGVEPVAAERSLGEHGGPLPGFEGVQYYPPVSRPQPEREPSPTGVRAAVKRVQAARLKDQRALSDMHRRLRRLLATPAPAPAPTPAPVAAPAAAPAQEGQRPRARASRSRSKKLLRIKTHASSAQLVLPAQRARRVTAVGAGGGAGAGAGVGAGRPPGAADATLEDESVVREVLGRLSDAQRHLVGQRTAAVKSHLVNTAGVEPKVRSLLADVVAPVLSRASILTLTAPGEDAVRRSLLQAHAAAAAAERALRGGGGGGGGGGARAGAVHAYNRWRPRPPMQLRLRPRSPAPVLALLTPRPASSAPHAHAHAARAAGPASSGTSAGDSRGHRGETSGGGAEAAGAGAAAPEGGVGGGGGGGRGHAPLTLRSLARLRYEVATCETDRKVAPFLREMRELARERPPQRPIDRPSAHGAAAGPAPPARRPHHHHHSRRHRPKHPRK